MILLSTLLLLVQSEWALAAYQCSQSKTQVDPKFYFISACQLSKLNVVTSRTVTNLASCQQLAVRKKAFALNFIHKELVHKEANLTGDTCLLYDCPEFDTERLTDESLYDYYSAYPILPALSKNLSCIPRVGVFRVHLEKRNYTQALNICKEEGGELADVSSETRTLGVSSLVAGARIHQAYVGVSELKLPHQFVTEKGIPLYCLPYRSWAPAEPKPHTKARCATVSNKGTWKAVHCVKKLPFVCEIIPVGPYRPCKLIKPYRLKRKCIRQFKSTLPTPKRLLKCGTPKQDNTTIITHSKGNRKNNGKGNRRRPQEQGPGRRRPNNDEEDDQDENEVPKRRRPGNRRPYDRGEDDEDEETPNRRRPNEEDEDQDEDDVPKRRRPGNRRRPNDRGEDDEDEETPNRRRPNEEDEDQDEDDVPKRRRPGNRRRPNDRGEDDEDEETPNRRRPNEEDEDQDEDDVPKRRRPGNRRRPNDRGEEEDEGPNKDDDDQEEDKENGPRRRRPNKNNDDDQEDEDELKRRQPGNRRRPNNDDDDQDEEEEEGPRRRRPNQDEDDDQEDDDGPKRRRPGNRRRPNNDQDEEDEDTPKRRRPNDDDDDDEPPRRRPNYYN